MTLDRIAKWFEEIRVLDGGIGSECQKRSRLPIDGHKAWSCRLLKEDPNLVCEVHKSYLRAGCDVLSTNTYQASPETLAVALKITDSEAKELMRHAVRLVRRAIVSVTEEECNTTRKLPTLVAGSLGPYGACLADGSEYTGSYVETMTFDRLVEFHQTRATILLEAGVDFLAWETIPVLTEVAAIVEVMKRIPHALAWLSVASFNGQTTVGGDPLHQIALEVQKCDQIFGLGVNCCIEHDKIGLALSNLNAGQDICGPGTEDGFHPPPCSKRPDHQDGSTARPRKLLILYANSGEKWIPPPKGRNRRRGHWVWPSNKGASTWARTMAQWSLHRCEPQGFRNSEEITPNVDRSVVYPKAQWVGGCCRVGPAEIHQLAKLIKPDEFSPATPLAPNPTTSGLSSELAYVSKDENRMHSGRKRPKIDRNRRTQPMRTVKRRKSKQ